MPLLVPGFIITGEPSASSTGSQWPAVRILDGHPFVLKVVPVADLANAQALAAEQMALHDRVDSEHVVRQHAAVALADGTVALVLDEVNGGSLSQLLGSRGQLTPGETVTTVAPLLRALDDLHGAGVVHGRLAPGSVLFTMEGRPLIGDLGVAALMGRQAGSPDGTHTSGFVAPELMGEAAPTPASDVYAMGALAWFCLAGGPPAPASRRASLARLSPGTPSGLVEVITACLAVDPAARPSAGVAAVEVFDAAPAQTVALASVADPAADITRRIRAGAASLSDPGAQGARKAKQRHNAWLAFGVVAFVLALALGIGGTWFLRRAPVDAHPAASRVTTPAQQPVPTLPAPATRPALQPATPRLAAARLLQALVDARALAYAARDSSLLGLVYAPGAAEASVDKRNIATARKGGGTYLGLTFLVQDVAFLDGRPGTARLRATVVTPAYETGQPNGRKVPHAREVLGPCIFSLSLTPAGWRIAGLTVA
ncbi:MAG: eukaryotic-like serine/threonine-protein kinase [Actinomycetota bacterium]|nr:eukaryotic-like serine/threonine-protein kinase [Actinomycetota bacterium]